MKITSIRKLFGSRKGFFKLIMRTFVFLFCSVCFALSSNKGLSQNANILIEKGKTMNVKQAFRLINKQTDFKFGYRSDLLKNAPQLFVEKGTIKVRTLLDRFLTPIDFTYEFTDNETILVKKATTTLEDKMLQANDLNVDQLQVSGTILDSQGVPLGGANVVEKGTSNGTQSDFDGNFSISVADENATLVVSYIGFTTKEVPVNQQTQITVTLEESASGLDEVIVVGYGSQSIKDVTGSYASIKSEAIEERPIASVEQALQGLTPGLQIAQRNSSPGQVSEISLRGVTSLSTSFAPLWVIDGFPATQRDAQAINPADIASVDILKDASATAIYGSRGANGVIIITTKNPQGGKSSFNVSVAGGVASASYVEDVLNASEFAQYYTESYANRGLTLPAGNFVSAWDGNTNVDYQDLIYRSAGFQNYSVSATGGSEKANYLVSGNYIDQEGITIGESYKKYSARLKAEFRPFESLKFGLNVAPNFTIEERSSIANDESIGGLGGGDISSLNALAAYYEPILPVRGANGEYTTGAFGALNPLEVAQNTDINDNRFNMLANTYIAYEPIEGLTLKSTLGYSLASRDREIYQLPSGNNRGNTDLIFYEVLKENSTGVLNENTINYKRDFGGHSIDILGGFTAQKDTRESLISNVRGFDVPGPRSLTFGNPDNLRSSNGFSETTLLSYLGRANYSYKGKYLITGTVRRDGSSRFGSNRRWANFASAAVGWTFSEEEFLKNSFIDFGKLRASYGESGNNGIPDYRALPSLANTTTAFGTSQVNGVRNDAPGNPNLTWETNTQLNVGLDLTLFKNRFNLTVDYYNIDTDGLLLNKPLPVSSGFPFFLTNIGSMTNKGVEITASTTVVDNEDWTVSVGGNITNNKNEITSLGDDEELQNFWGVFRHQVGEELDQMQGLQQVGIAGENDPNGIAPGDVVFRDVNGDGTIDNFLGEDRVSLGSPNQDWIYGFNTRVRYKDFEFTTLWQGQAGAQVYDFYLIQIGSGINNFNVAKAFHYDGRYIDAANPGDGSTPRAGWLGTSPGGSVSSPGIQNTDYLRIRNATLAYNLPDSLSDRIGIKNARIYASVENLYTFTKFIGNNPDSRRRQGGPLGGARLDDTTVQYGLITTAAAPLPRTLTLGINFSL